MLEEIRVKSFKSLNDVTLKLGSVNVFIGANGSGKSNLLEALGVLSAAASGVVDDEALMRRGVRPGVPALYKSSFKKRAKHPRTIDIGATSTDKYEYRVKLYNPISDPEPIWRYETEYLLEKERKVIGRSNRSNNKLNPERGLVALKSVEFRDKSMISFLKSLQEYCIYSPDTSTLRGLDSDTQQRSPLGLSGGRLAEAIVEYLWLRKTWQSKRREHFEELSELIDWMETFTIGHPSQVPLSPSIPRQRYILRFKDKYMSTNRNALSGFDASEGALFVLFMAALTHHESSPKICAVDNFDQALHPRLAKQLSAKLVKWVTASKQQLLLTSHNPAVLDGLPLFREDVKLFAVDRSSLGSTVVSPIVVTEEMLHLAKTGVPLSQQWMMGIHGGIPKEL